MFDALPAYAAGLVDGEGCITINRYADPKAKVPCRYWVIVIVGMTNPEALRPLWQRWGGSLALRKAKRQEWRDIWLWQISCKKAERFLRDVLPYLRAKRSQAECALAFMENRGTRSVRCGNRGKTLSPEALGVREDYYQRMKALNSA